MTLEKEGQVLPRVLAEHGRHWLEHWALCDTEIEVLSMQAATCVNQWTPRTVPTEKVLVKAPRDVSHPLPRPWLLPSPSIHTQLAELWRDPL